MTTETPSSSPESELEILNPQPSELELSSGTVVRVERLKTRQLFRLLRILTAGAGPALAELDITADTDPAELTKDIVGLLVLSVGDAEDEAIEFIQSMVSPINLIEPQRTKADRVFNDELFVELYSELTNPPIEDTIDILTRVIQVEAPHMLALGKRLAALIPSVAKPTTSSTKRSKK